ncbi:hypothetical protein HHK36_023037 [Tetracentron sinense]|uniref:Uncharacterized protein n=1 Tax=Tetracentron sinense TaxID=13715 RepID=A0A835D6L8_TETSI|nr:hypothetical protein HHK36_023037 [Tetracentron sinense]
MEPGVSRKADKRISPARTGQIAGYFGISLMTGRDQIKIPLVLEVQGFGGDIFDFCCFSVIAMFVICDRKGPI